MHKPMKYLVMAVSIFILAGVSGCGKKQQGQASSAKTPVRVAFWGAVEEKEIITKTITEWQKTNKSIDVVLEHIPAGSYLDKVLTEIAGGNPPDIIFCEVNVFVTFFYKNALLDLSQFLANDKDFNIENFFPEIVARFTKDGKVFCIPRDTAPFACIYYNKTLFDKMQIPYPKDDWDLNGLLAVAKKLTIDENGKHPGEAGFNDRKIKRYGYWDWAWKNYVYSFGGKLVDDINNPTKCLLNEKEAIEGIKFFIDLSYKYNVSPKPEALTGTGMNINQLFVMEKLAMFQTGIWETPNLRQIVGDRFQWDVAMFPKGPAGKHGFGTGGSGYAILKTSKHPDEAWEVIKCLAGNSGQEMLAKSGLGQPANRAIAQGQFFAGSANPPLNKKMLNEAVKYAVYDPFNPLWKELEDKYIVPQMDQIVNNRITVENGVKKIVEQLNAALAEKK